MKQLPLQVDYSGKVVVITGAGGLICGAMARAFAMSGAKVAALDLNENAVKALADEMTAQGYICRGYAANVLDKASLEKAHEAVLADFGKSDSVSLVGCVTRLHIAFQRRIVCACTMPQHTFDFHRACAFVASALCLHTHIRFVRLIVLHGCFLLFIQNVPHKSGHKSVVWYTKREPYCRLPFSYIRFI